MTWHNFTISLQVIIAASWIFSSIFNFPLFVVRSYNDERKECFLNYPEEWMTKAREMAWLFLTILPLGVMIGLYSRVLYILWFKSKEDSQLTYQQKVSGLTFFLLHSCYQ